MFSLLNSFVGGLVLGGLGGIVGGYLVRPWLERVVISKFRK